MSLLLALLLDIPVGELDYVRHEGEHYSHLHPVEKTNKTPVDLPRRNSEDSPNEDRPASTADQRRNGSTQGANSHTQVAISFRWCSAILRRGHSSLLDVIRRFSWGIVPVVAASV